jgi:hypothetical protein
LRGLFLYVFADPASLLDAPILLEAEVYPAIDTRVVDISVISWSLEY